MNIHPDVVSFQILTLHLRGFHAYHNHGATHSMSIHLDEVMSQRCSELLLSSHSFRTYQRGDSEGIDHGRNKWTEVRNRVRSYQKTETWSYHSASKGRSSESDDDDETWLYLYVTEETP